MGVLEDIRKVLQDFMAPQLGAIVSRLEAIDKRLDAIERRQDRDLDTVLRAIEVAKAEVLLIIRNEQLRDQLAEKDRVIERLQKGLPAPQ